MSVAALKVDTPEERGRYITLGLIPIVLLVGAGLLRAGRSYVKGEQAETLVVVGKNQRTLQYLQKVRAKVSPPVQIVGVLDCAKNSVTKPLAKIRQEEN